MKKCVHDLTEYLYSMVTLKLGSEVQEKKGTRVIQIDGPLCKNSTGPLISKMTDCWNFIDAAKKFVKFYQE